MRWMLMIGLPLVTLARTLECQPPLAVGSRVRILAPDTARTANQQGSLWYAGTVIAGSPGTVSLQLMPERPALMLSLADVSRIDVSRGRGNHRRDGMLVGGLLSGAAFVGSVCAFSNGSCSIGNNIAGFVLYYATGAIPGVLVGGSIGARMPAEERWETVWNRSAPIPPAPR